MESSSRNIWLALIGILIIGLLIFIGVRSGNKTQNELPIINTDQMDQAMQQQTDQTAPLQANQSTSSDKKVMQTATIKTNMGTFVIKLDTENTPNTAANFTKLATSGFYNGTRFHRIIPDFMIQGGDPQSADVSKRSAWGTGGPGYQFADEIKPTNSNAKYTISMANAGPNTNGSQFFINVADNSFLNTKHTVFGTVTSGMDVVQKISEVKTGANDQPVEDVIVESIVIS